MYNLTFQLGKKCHLCDNCIHRKTVSLIVGDWDDKSLFVARSKFVEEKKNRACKVEQRETQDILT